MTQDDYVQHIGPEVTCPLMRQRVLDARGNPEMISRLAAEIGDQLGMPDADHFFVPIQPGARRADDLRAETMTCFLAAMSRKKTKGGER